jgi:hypothetical protein
VRVTAALLEETPSPTMFSKEHGLRCAVVSQGGEFLWRGGSFWDASKL